MARFEPNPEGIAQMQAEMNDRARAMIREVNAEMTGRPAAEVLAALTSRMQAAGFEPNVTTLRECAQSISDGTCT
jgi:hypothetical protein